MKIVLYFLCFILFNSLASIKLVTKLYTPQSPVVLLNKETFLNNVLKSKKLWLIEFYANPCNLCFYTSTEYEKAASELNGINKIGAIDVNDNQDLVKRYSISKFPTFLFFGNNKQNPENYIKYYPSIKANQIINYMLNQSNNLIDNSLNFLINSFKYPNNSTLANVYDLTDSNFDDIVTSSNDVWIVEFYTDWCSFCEEFAPKYQELANKLKGKVKFGRVEVDDNINVKSRFDIHSFPIVKIFPPGQKSDKMAQKYTGEKEVTPLVNYILNNLKQFNYSPDIIRIENNDEIIRNCKKTFGICVVSLLEKNNKLKVYLNEIEKARNSNKKRKIYYLWTNKNNSFCNNQKAGQKNSEYPIITIIDYINNAFAMKQIKLNENNLNDFVNNYILGNEKIFQLK